MKFFNTLALVATMMASASGNSNEVRRLTPNSVRRLTPDEARGMNSGELRRLAAGCPPTATTLNLVVEVNVEFTDDQNFILQEVCDGVSAFVFQFFFQVGMNVFNYCLDPMKEYTFQFTDNDITANEDTMIDSFTLIWGGTNVGSFTQTDFGDDFSVGFGTCGGPPPESTGDPHFKTLAGLKFDYHGACDLVLMSAPEFHNGLGMDVHIRTKSRYEYSYIETAAIKIGDDILEVSSFGEHFFNGVEAVKFPITMGGVVTVEETRSDLQNHVFVLDIGQGETITLKSFKDLVAVILTNKHSIFGSNVSGILGRFDYGALPMDNVARDGTTLILDPVEFSEEWQVRDNELKLFQNMDHFPQYPEKCVRPKITTEERRRLGERSISEEQATAACKTAGRIDDMEACVYDVIATGDLEMVQAGAM